MAKRRKKSEQPVRVSRKSRVNMFVDDDVVEGFKAAAAARGIGYQTLMNEKLRESLGLSGPSLAERVARLEAALSKNATGEKQ